VLQNQLNMSLRFQAIESLTADTGAVNAPGSTKITGIFGENVFTIKTAREFLSDEAYKSLVTSIKGGKKN
jgi:glutamine synthetase